VSGRADTFSSTHRATGFMEERERLTDGDLDECGREHDVRTGYGYD
jgi:hypothetical protein